MESVLVHTFVSREKTIENLVVFILSQLQRNLNKGVSLFLSGGSLVDVYVQFGIYLKQVRHTHLALAQVDERFQPSQKTDNSKQITVNRGQKNTSSINAIEIGKTGLWNVCKGKNIPVHLVSQKGTLGISAQGYEKEIKQLFSEDFYKIALLGMGKDGHTAGLLPGYGQKWNIDHLVVGYRNTGQFPQRITLTPKALRLMDVAVVYVVGEKKRSILKKLQDYHNRKNLGIFPAIILDEIKYVHLFTDVQI
ncbi:6-phosphogluconolactonase [Candidatus Gottesmanbacteria bacterium]|nr:6-phosphogluconolactonase [Candidatus Gottesmanbacteria bacterium]